MRGAKIHTAPYRMRLYIPSPLGKVARAERTPDEVYKVSFRNLIRLASQSNQTVGIPSLTDDIHTCGAMIYRFWRMIYKAGALILPVGDGATTSRLVIRKIKLCSKGMLFGPSGRPVPTDDRIPPSCFAIHLHKRGRDTKRLVLCVILSGAQAESNP